MSKNIKKLFGFLVMLSTCYSPTELPKDEIQVPIEGPYFVVSKLSDVTFRGKYIIMSVECSIGGEFQVSKGRKSLFASDIKVGDKLLLSDMVDWELTCHWSGVELTHTMTGTAADLETIEEFISKKPS